MFSAALGSTPPAPVRGVPKPAAARPAPRAVMTGAAAKESAPEVPTVEPAVKPAEPDWDSIVPVATRYDGLGEPRRVEYCVGRTWWCAAHRGGALP